MDELFSYIFHLDMMTSSNGNLFRVTGHLCGEFTGPRWIPRTKTTDAELWCFLWSASELKFEVNNREAGDLRRYSAHHDVIVMKQHFKKNLNHRNHTVYVDIRLVYSWEYFNLIFKFSKVNICLFKSSQKKATFWKRNLNSLKNIRTSL